jgi:hypothetical protein
MDNVKSALARLQSTVIFIPDSEIQVEIDRAIEELQKELHDRSETPDAADEICYGCRHMCGIRRRYIGGVMLKCVGYEKAIKESGGENK